MKSSFGGSSRTFMMLCASPFLLDYDVTLSTLKFGQRAKLIKNKI